MEKYFLRVVRVAAKNKLPDRWIHSQWYHPLDAEEAGTTFVLIEVLNPWFPQPQITTTITNTFNREYFRQRRTAKTPDAFEFAVRRVNEALAERAEQGETDWIGSLHAVLAVVVDDELHMVQAGRGRAYIIREGTASPALSEKTLEETPHPLQTFSSIVSGNLEPGDKGVFATPDLLDYLSLEQLTAMMQKPVRSAALELVRTLQDKRTKSPHAVIFDYSDNPQPELGPGEEDTIYLDQPLEKGFSRLKSATTQYVVPAISTGAKAAGSAASWFWGKTRDDLLPRFKSGASAIAQKGKQGFQQAANKAAPMVGSMAQKAQEKLTTVAQNVPAIDTAALPEKVATPVASVSNKLISLAKSIKLKGRLLAVAAAIVVVAVVGLRVVTLQKDREVKVAKSAAQESLGAAQSKKQEADLAIIYNETDRAVSLYVEALDLAKKAGENPDVKQSADKVYSEAQKSLDGLTQTTRINTISPIGSLTGATHFTRSADSFWGIDSAGQVVSTSTKSTLTLKSSVPVVGLAAIEEHKKVFVAGNEQVGSINTTDGSGSLLTKPEGGWPKLIALDKFGTNIYFLDPTASQIWKYATSGDGLSSPPTKFFAETQNLKNALDMAIDGRIYILLSDGTINRYFKGTKEDFAIAGLPKPYDKLVKPTMIVTAADAASFYVFDASDKRIVVLDKKGAYQKQFALPENWEVKDLIIDDSKLYVLVGNDVYEIAL